MLKLLIALKVKNGNVPKWDEAIETINTFSKGEVVLNSPYIQIKCNDVNTNELIIELEKLLPWRKRVHSCLMIF